MYPSRLRVSERATRVRPDRIVSVRAPLTNRGVGNPEERPWHLAANRSCRSRRPEPSMSRRAAADTHPTKACPWSSRPDRCQRMTSSVTGRNRRCWHSVHLTRGFSQTPRTHSLAHAGAYPDLPVVLLSKRLGYTSARPRNRDPKSAIFSVDEEFLLTGTGFPLMVVRAGTAHGCRRSATASVRRIRPPMCIRTCDVRLHRLDARAGPRRATCCDRHGRPPWPPAAGPAAAARSRCAIPANSAASVDAVSGGASITSPPPAVC